MPAARNSSRTPRTSSSARTPQSARLQPSRASARAMPSPMPRVPPVTSATRTGAPSCAGFSGVVICDTDTSQGDGVLPLRDCPPSATVRRWRAPQRGPTARLSCARTEEREIRFAAGLPQHVERGLAQMIIAPLAGLAAGRARARWNEIPPVRIVIHRVQQQPLMLRCRAEIRPVGIDERCKRAQTGLLVAGAILAALPQKRAEPQQALHRDRRGRTIDRLMI